MPRLRVISLLSLGVVVVFGIFGGSARATTTSHTAEVHFYDQPSFHIVLGGHPVAVASVRLGLGAQPLRLVTDTYGLNARFGVAAKEGADVAYHYTFKQFVASIEKNGLRPGSYATPDGTLSPLQAQIDLALPPNRGLTDAVLRVDIAGLRKAGYEIPKASRVARSFKMPGGGYEMRFPYEIPPEYVSVVRR